MASFRHFAWRFFVISSFCVASFRYFVFSRGVFSLFRVALFRYFVFSRGVISLFRYFAWRYFVTKRRKDEMAQISHHKEDSVVLLCCIRTPWIHHFNTALMNTIEILEESLQLEQINYKP